jgi:hypothetical protein
MFSDSLFTNHPVIQIDKKNIELREVTVVGHMACLGEISSDIDGKG